MRKIYLFLLMSIFTLTFVACSEDEPNSGNNGTEETVSPAEAVAGTYDGSLSVSIAGGEPIVSSQKVSIEKVSDNSINFLLKDFSIVVAGSPINVGDVKLTDVALVKDGDKYTFTAEQTLKLDVTGNGTPMDVPVKIESGSFSGNTLNTSISITMLGGAMTVAVEFEGTKTENSTDSGTEEPVVVPAESVAGTYNGSLSVSIAGGEPIVSEQEVNIEKVDDNTINFLLKDFSIVVAGSPLNVGDIKLTDVALVKDGDKYTFTTEQTLKLDITGTGALVDVPVKIESGSFSGKTLKTSISISMAGGALTVAVEFEGIKD